MKVEKKSANTKKCFIRNVFFALKMTIYVGLLIHPDKIYTHNTDAHTHTVFRQVWVESSKKSATSV